MAVGERQSNMKSKRIRFFQIGILMLNIVTVIGIVLGHLHQLAKAYGKAVKITLI